jgi:hypothetical protein
MAAYTPQGLVIPISPYSYVIFLYFFTLDIHGLLAQYDRHGHGSYPCRSDYFTRYPAIIHSELLMEIEGMTAE